MDKAEAVLDARDVSLTYRTRAGSTVGLCPTTLRIDPGEHVALLGPNGSGKSTLLALASTSAVPDSGSLTVAGVPITGSTPARELAKARAALGVVFQSPALDPLLTIHENLRTAAALAGLKHTEASDAIGRVLADLRIADRKADRVSTLSGGLTRRADLARALLTTPRLIILDEPTTGLDPDARRDLMAVLDALRERANPPAVLLSTHLTDEAERADRIVFLHRGRVAADGTPDALRRRPGACIVTVAGDPSAADGAMRAAGLVPEHTAGRSRAAIDEADIPSVAAELGRQGRSFTIGPASLDDAYAQIVGRSLGTADEEAAP